MKNIPHNPLAFSRKPCNFTAAEAISLTDSHFAENAGARKGFSSGRRKLEGLEKDFLVVPKNWKG